MKTIPTAHLSLAARITLMLIALWWLWHLASAEAFEVMSVAKRELAAVPTEFDDVLYKGLARMNAAAQAVVDSIERFYSPPQFAAPGEDVFLRILNAIVPEEFLTGRIRVLHALAVLFWIRLHAASNIAFLWLLASAAWWFDGWSMRSVTAARFHRVLPAVSAASLSAGIVLPWLAIALLFVPESWAPTASLAVGSAASVSLGLWFRTYHKPASEE